MKNADLTGGAVYHLKALAHANQSWSQFRNDLWTELSKWKTKFHDEIILVGSSGGYCLDSRWLDQFQKILLVEVDPLARLIFRFRHGRKVESITHDILLTKDLGEWNQFLQKHPQANILFCNILGQLPLLVPQSTPAREAWGTQRIQEILRPLSNRSWASFHDRLSFLTDAKEAYSFAGPSSWQSTEQLVAESARAWKFSEVCDHMTSEIAKDKRVAYLSWPLDSKTMHIIEFISQVANPN